MKNKLLTSVVVVILILLAASPILADALFSGIIRVTNSGASAASGVSVNLTLDSDAFVASGDMEPDFSDVSIQYNGVEMAFMPGYGTNPWIFFVPAIGPETSLDYSLFTIGATGGKLCYFPGDGGMETIDDISLEYGDNFTYEFQGYIDTSVTGVISEKSGAIEISSGSGNITAIFGSSNLTADRKSVV